MKTALSLSKFAHKISCIHYSSKLNFIPSDFCTIWYVHTRRPVALIYIRKIPLSHIWLQSMEKPRSYVKNCKQTDRQMAFHLYIVDMLLVINLFVGMHLRISTSYAKAISALYQYQPQTSVHKY